MTFPEPKLRPARPDDVLLLQEIERTARRRYATIPELKSVVDAPGIAPERFSSGITLVAEAEGRPVGYAIAEIFDGMTYLANIAVIETAGRRGIGRRLIDSVERLGRAAATDGIALTTFRTPEWNGPYFRKLGFAPISPSRIGPGLQAILDRHAGFLDMTTRETLWRPIADQAASTIAQ